MAKKKKSDKEKSDKSKSQKNLEMLPGDRGFEPIDPIEPKEIILPTVLQKDARLLRECLCGLVSKVPPMFQQKIHQTLLAYAAAVRPYCKCQDRTLVAKEKMYACLDCGKRHKNPPGNDLELVKS